MENTLHILNGDSTYESFAQTGIDGDILVWREVLSEGPLEENIASGHFWKARAEWMNEPDYDEKVIQPLSKLSEPYKEFNLWFEFDLHCQVNMLGVIMMLSKHTDLSSPNIYLICPDSFPGITNFRGMGDLNEEQLEYLYDNIRVQLGEPDFFVAAEAWKIYTGKDPDELREYLAKNKYWGNLHCLKKALEAQIERIVLNSKGFNYIEQKLLDIYNSGAKTKSAIYQKFWETESIYGMGDMELDIYLNKLKELDLIEV